MIVLRALLFPFSLLYGLMTLFRNYLYDIGHRKSFRFETMVIGVGNLNVGGSGKTPMIEHLAKLLLPSRKLAILSRGYGRRTKGLRFASENDSADSIGDEPFQFFRKFGNDVVITVGEDRAFAIPHILQHEPAPEVVLLDDAFQHRAVNPQFSILLTDYALPFYKDFVMPVGNLRELRTGAKRSDVIVVTKCPPNFNELPSEEIERKIDQYAPGVPVFFAGLEYSTPVSFGLNQRLSHEIILVTGIANSKPVVDYLKLQYSIVRHFSFRDHHHYSQRDLSSIQEFCKSVGKPICIFTTEKDMVKLIDPSFKSQIASAPWFYLPIRIAFLNNGSNFDNMVLQAIKSFNQNN